MVVGLWVTQDLQEVVRPYLKRPPKPPNHILVSELFSHPLLLGTGIIRHETATFGGRRGFLAVKLKRMGPVLGVCRIWDFGMSRDTMPELSPVKCTYYGQSTYNGQSFLCDLPRTQLSPRWSSGAGTVSMRVWVTIRSLRFRVSGIAVRALGVLNI